MRLQSKRKWLPSKNALRVDGKAMQSQYADGVAKSDRAWAEACVFCQSTTCSLCTVCFLKCDGNVIGSHKAQDCKYRAFVSKGGSRKSEMEQNAMYDGSCPICCTDEMYDRKSLPRSVMHSPLGCRLRTAGRVPVMQCRMSRRGMLTKMRSAKPKKTSFKPYWHDQKLKAKYTAAKGGGRGRGSPFGGGLRGRGRGRGRGVAKGHPARVNAAAAGAQDDDDEGVDARQQLNKNKATKKEKAAQQAEKQQQLEAADAESGDGAVDDDDAIVGTAAGTKPKGKRKRRGAKKRGKKKDVGTVQIGSAQVAVHGQSAPGTIDEFIQPHDVEEEGPHLSLHYLKLVDALGKLQCNRANSSVSVQPETRSGAKARPMPTPSSF